MNQNNSAKKSGPNFLHCSVKDSLLLINSQMLDYSFCGQMCQNQLDVAGTQGELGLDNFLH